MPAKSMIAWMAKILGLTVLYFLCVMLGGALFVSSRLSLPAEQQTAAMLSSLLAALVCTSLLGALILYSRWGGWRLMLALGFSYYGIQTFMAQIETAYFGPAFGVPSSDLPGLFAMSLVVIFVFIPLAVVVLGKGRQPAQSGEENRRLQMPAGEWLWKLALIAVAYLVLYFGFGYFVAWQNPNLVAMYGGGTNTEVFDNARLVPFQVLRSGLWVLFALPVIRMSRPGVWGTAILIGLLYALPMSIGLVGPNPYMPDASVRLSHFIEIITSNFLFGLIVTHLLLWRRKAAR